MTITDDQLRAQLRQVWLRLNGDGTLTLNPGTEPIDPQGQSVEEIAQRVRFLLPAKTPSLEPKVTEALVRSALGRRGKRTYLLDAL